MLAINPPPSQISIPIVHKISETYKTIYRLGKNLPKNDKLGPHLKLEQQCLECLRLSIESALSPRQQKIPILLKLKIEIEVGKRLGRIEHELQIINTQDYILLEQSLAEISKMATGWINYCKKESA